MVYKNYLIKKRNLSGFIFEILVPVIYVAYLRYIYADPCASPKQCSDIERATNQKINQIRNPIILVIVLPALFSVGQRFILQSMVHEKVTKIRETLRLMSLS